MSERTLGASLTEGMTDEEALEFALRTPDMYPARNIAAASSMTVKEVHTWRRERGIRKARS